MNQRMHASDRPRRPDRLRRGFTLIELLVVMAVIAILMSLTAAGVMAWMNGNSRNITETELRGLHAILMQHWSAVVESAKKERLWNTSDYPANTTPTLMSFAENDNERARILLIKLRLMEAFPVNFTDLAPPTLGAPMTGAECYVSPPSGPFNPLSLIPPGAGKGGKRRYRAAYQAMVYDPTKQETTLTPTPSPPVCAPRWSRSYVTGKESVESAVCLWAALNTAKEGISPENDQLQAWMKDTDGTGNKVFADAWGTPLRFYRFATQDKTSTSLDSPLQLIAPLGIAQSYAVDPIDINGKLLPSISVPAGMTAPTTPWGTGNALTYDATIHQRGYPYPTTQTPTNAQFAIPVIASAGPDGKFGIPAADKWTTPNATSPLRSVPNSIAGSAPWQDMTVKSIPDEADNIYSFKKQGS